MFPDCEFLILFLTAEQIQYYISKLRTEFTKLCIFLPKQKNIISSLLCHSLSYDNIDVRSSEMTIFMNIIFNWSIDVQKD